MYVSFKCGFILFSLFGGVLLLYGVSVCFIEKELNVGLDRESGRFGKGEVYDENV